MLAACVPMRDLPSVLETQPPVTAELPCLATARDMKWVTKSAWALHPHCALRWWEGVYRAWNSLKPKVSPTPKHHLCAIYVPVVGIRGIKVCTGFLWVWQSSMVNSLSSSSGEASPMSFTSTTLSQLSTYSSAILLLLQAKTTLQERAHSKPNIQFATQGANPQRQAALLPFCCPFVGSRKCQLSHCLGIQDHTVKECVTMHSPEELG